MIFLSISASTWWIVPLKNAPSTCKHQLQCNDCFNSAEIVWNPSFLLLPEVIEKSIKNQPDIIGGLKSTYQRNSHYTSFIYFIWSWMNGLFEFKCTYRCWYGPLLARTLKYGPPNYRVHINKIKARNGQFIHINLFTDT